jgi:Cu-Zn family superoxide dismutase
LKCLPLLVLAVLLGLAGYAVMQRPGSGITARAEIRNANKQPAGTATFTEGPGGVRIVVQAKGLPPGPHGLHIHEVGTCDAPKFMTAAGISTPRRGSMGR